MHSTWTLSRLALCAALSIAVASCAPAPRQALTPAVPAEPSTEASQTHSDEAATRAAIEKLSLDIQGLILACPGDDNAEVRSCVGDALEKYAAGLAPLKDKLSPQLADLPDIVATAAHRVREAKTKKQAVQAVKAAIGAVHKTIALLRADNSLTLAARTREGTLVAETLQVAQNKLEKAVGL